MDVARNSVKVARRITLIRNQEFVYLSDYAVDRPVGKFFSVETSSAVEKDDQALPTF